MAAKKQSNRRGTTKATSRRKTAGKKAAAKKTTTKKQGVTSGFQTEIILWIFFAASVILIISNLGMGVQLLDKTRKINKLLHNNNSSKVVGLLMKF